MFLMPRPWEEWTFFGSLVADRHDQIHRWLPNEFFKRLRPVARRFAEEPDLLIGGRGDPDTSTCAPGY